MGFISNAASFGVGYAIGGHKPGVRSLAERVMVAIGIRRASPTGGDIGSLMTSPPRGIAPSSSLIEAAQMMAEGDMGDVLVLEPGSKRLVGILTDRDIAVRAVAKGLDPSLVSAGEVMSTDVITVSPSATTRGALERMQQSNVRRLPVVDGDLTLGIVSLGDLSDSMGAGKTLSDISHGAPDL